MEGENNENDTRTIVWMENILSVFGARTPFVDGALKCKSLNTNLSWMCKLLQKTNK